jgi:O-antigen/teichoic acid export membrane protein
MANLCLGVFFNLSIWYKISGQTKWGAWLAIFGAVITLAFNFWLIPIMGYMGAAWTTLICYAAMMILSYGVGQRHYRVNYDLKSFAFYIILSLALFFFSNYLREHFQLARNMMLIINSGFMIVFLLSAFLFERNRISYLRAVKKME